MPILLRSARWASPVIELDHPGGLRFRLEGMRLQFDAPDMGAEHDDGAGLSALARDRELETVDPSDPAPATAVALQADAPECHVAVQQFDVQLLAMALRGQQRPLADATGTG